MKIGTTSFGFRYLLLDPALAPSLESVVDRTRRFSLNVLQVCENARPMELPDTAWRQVVRRAKEREIELQLGCKTTCHEVFKRYLERAAELPSRLLRLVFEEEEGAPPSRGAVDRFLEAVWPALESAGVRLAIENHFDVPCRVLAGAVARYPAARLGFCVDTANSLRNFESPEMVLDLLGSRAFCYHLKDFRVDGDKLGFRVSGARLGEGRLDLDGLLRRIFMQDPDPLILIENWVPTSGDRETDISEDDAWLRAGVEVLRSRMAAMGFA